MNANFDDTLLDALFNTVDAWVSTVFEGIPVADKKSLAVQLNALWLTLANLLFVNDSIGRENFMRESTNLVFTSRNGYIPRDAFQEKARRLIELNTPSLFLVMSIRQAIGEIIRTKLPHTKETWDDIADSSLPLNLYFIAIMDESQSPGYSRKKLKGNSYE